MIKRDNENDKGLEVDLEEYELPEGFEDIEKILGIKKNINKDK